MKPFSLLNPETITVIDPACGSGHILVEAYDVLKAIYLERGYQLRSIPRLILEKNLYGLDIDDRAAQLAGFALLMKARADDRRLFDELPKLNVYSIQSSKNLNLPLLWRQLDLNGQSKPGTTSSLFDEPQTDLVQVIDDSHYQLIKNTLALFEQAQTLGSLIQVPAGHAEPLKDLLAQLQALTTEGNSFQKIAATTLIPFIRQAVILAMQFDAVVANPPYMGNKYLTPLLKSYLKENYKGFEKDLFSAFMIRGLSLTNESGQLGFMSPFVWMFISSYQELRSHFIDNATLTSLIQLEYSGFDGATVPICTFTLSKAHVSGYTGSYIRLSDFRGSDQQAPKTLEAIQNPSCGWFYNAKPDDFKKISGSPIAYWVSDKVRDIFTNNLSLGEVADARQGLATADNDRFLRLWHEIEINRIGFSMVNRDQAKQSTKKWFPFNKAGAFRKWYGNQDFVLNWENDGEEVRNFTDDKGKQRSVIRNPNYYFQESVSWSDVTSSTNAFRFFPTGFIHGNVAHSIFNFSEGEKLSLLSYCNNKFCSNIIKILSPTLHFDIGYFNNLPYPKKLENCDLSNVSKLISISKTDWNNYETSWDFTENPLIRQKQNTVGWVSDRDCESIRVGGALASTFGAKAPPTPNETMAYSHVGYASRTITGDLHHSEKVRDAYPTLEATYQQWQTQSRVAIIEMQRLEEENNRLFIEAYGLQDELSPEVPEAQITLARADREKDSQRLISYAIGCMMGRYRLDRPGLIYAHAGNVDFEIIYQGDVGATSVAHEQSSEFQGRLKSPPQFAPDTDGIVPITDELWFEDDAANRITEFLLAVWNTETLEENKAWLAESLGQKGNETPQETIRRYIAGSFYKNHLQTYKKRPIYWLFSSGKQGAFQALVYLHRYNESTLARMRAEYVVPLTGKIQSRIDMLKKDAAAASSNAEKSKLDKDIDKLGKKYVELLSFDEKLRHYADLRIQLNLDDGVKVNYGKFGDLLAEVKAVTGGAND